MPNRNSPIRWDKIIEGKLFLADLELSDATSPAKLFFLFRNRMSKLKGFSLLEICLILHPDKYYRDPNTGKKLPTNKSIQATKQEIRDFRKSMKDHSVILYCLHDKETGAQIYFNIPTLELFEIVKRRIDRIIKGLQTNKKNALEVLGLSKKERNKLSKNRADLLRRQQIEKLKRKLSKRRKQELEEIVASEAESQPQQQEQTENNKGEE